MSAGEPSKSRVPRRKLLDEERENLRVNRQKKRDELDAFMKSAEEKIREMAREAAERWPSHTEDYYYKMLLSAPNEPTERKTSDWNIFQSRELKKANDGMTTIVGLTDSLSRECRL